MAKKVDSAVKAGDQVEWKSQQGTVVGKVVAKKTGIAKAGGHMAKASKEEPQFEVKSDKTGKTAIHKPAALKKVAKKTKKSEGK